MSIGERFKEVNDIAKEVPNNTQEELKQALNEKIGNVPVWSEYSKNEQRELIQNFVENKIDNSTDKDAIVDNLLNSLADFGAVQYLLDNENVSSVNIIGTKAIYITINGKTLNTENVLTQKQLSYIITNISGIEGFDKEKQICKLKTDKYLITFVNQSLCSTGVNILIEKKVDYTPSMLTKNGFMSKSVYDFLENAIESGKRLIISGPVNSGKSSLLSILLKVLSDKRVYCLSENPIDENIVNFKLSDDCEFITYIEKSSPEYIVTDSNDAKFAQLNASIMTIRSSGIENTLKYLISSYVSSGLTEKFAKSKVLKDYDYIVQLEKSENGPRISSVVELTPAKTMPLSIKTVVKFSNGKYEINNNYGI